MFISFLFKALYSLNFLTECYFSPTENAAYFAMQRDTANSNQQRSCSTRLFMVINTKNKLVWQGARA